MGPETLRAALTQPPALDAPTCAILEALCTAGDSFVPFSRLHKANGFDEDPFLQLWSTLLQRCYTACGCTSCRGKSRFKAFHIFDGLRLAGSGEWAYRLPPQSRTVAEQCLASQAPLREERRC